MGILGVILVLAASVAAQSYDHAPAVPSDVSGPYVPITPEERWRWLIHSTVGWESLLVAGPINAGFGTAVDRPKEYGPHWDGFAERYGVRLLQVPANNAIESGLGSVWGEDPRYFRAAGQPFKQRVMNVFDLTVRAYRSDGQRHIAYARLSAEVGSNFLANTWLPPSQSDAQSAMWRSLTGLGSRAAGNAMREFMPDLLHLLHRKDSTQPEGLLR